MKTTSDLMRLLLDTPSYGSTEEICNVVEKELRSTQFETTLLDFNGVHNLRVITPFQKGLPHMVWNCHLDTVKNDQVTFIEPDRVSGRGAVNCKGSAVAMIQALQNLKPKLPINLTVLFVGDEESFGPNGTLELMTNWVNDPDYLLVAAPTDLKLTTQERGVLQFCIKSEGVSGHVGAIDDTLNACLPLMQYALELQQSSCANVSINLGVLDVPNHHANTVPDVAYGTWDIRYETVSDYDRLKAEIERLCHKYKVSIVRMTNSLPFGSPGNLFSQYMESFIPFLFIKADEKGMIVKAVGSSDARHTKELPFVCFGPGSGTLGHSGNEVIELAQIQTATQILIHLAENFHHEPDLQ